MEDLEAKKDLEIYYRALSRNDVSRCIGIERKYDLFGYPPNIVGSALNAKAQGLDMATFLDEMMGG